MSALLQRIFRIEAGSLRRDEETKESELQGLQRGLSQAWDRAEREIEREREGKRERESTKRNECFFVVVF